MAGHPLNSHYGSGGLHADVLRVLEIDPGDAQPIADAVARAVRHVRAAGQQGEGLPASPADGVIQSMDKVGFVFCFSFCRAAVGNTYRLATTRSRGKTTLPSASREQKVWTYRSASACAR